MIARDWQYSFVRLGPLHEGLPVWFWRFVEHVIESHHTRRRISIYTARNAINASDGSGYIYSADIKRVLKRFQEEGISFLGIHKHKILLDKRILSYWKRFLVGARQKNMDDISFMIHALRGWRVCDIIHCDAFVSFLPRNYKIKSKEEIIACVLRGLLNSRKAFHRYDLWERQHVSSLALRLLNVLTSGETSIGNLSRIYWRDSAEEIWSACGELCNTLLVKPIYVENGEGTELHLVPFRIAKHGRILNIVTTKERSHVVSVLDVVLKQTCTALRDDRRSDCTIMNSLLWPERQILLFLRLEKDSASALDFLRWLKRAIGNGNILETELPETNYSLLLGTRNKCCPLVCDGYERKVMLSILLKYGFLNRSESGVVRITELGHMAVDQGCPDLDVRVTWGRNVNRLGIVLGAVWPEQFRRLLSLVAVDCGGGSYCISEESLREKDVSEDILLLIVGGFVRLDERRVARLRGWLGSDRDH